MKLFLASVSSLAVSCCVVLSCAAAPLGSPRPQAQANFQQLLKTKSCPGCDLAGVTMIRLDLRKVDLEGANLAGAQLFLADLSDANLKNANLQGASLGGADLAGADLRGANLTGAVLEGAFLETAKIDGNFITRPPIEEDTFAGSGEKVYVPAEEQSKQMPYTHDVAVGKRQDLESPPPVINDTDAGEIEYDEPQSKTIPSSQTVQSAKPPVTTKSTSKKIVPMADAVIAEPEATSVKTAQSVEKEIPEQSKKQELPKKLPVIEPVTKIAVVEKNAVKPVEVTAAASADEALVAEEPTNALLTGKNKKTEQQADTPVKDTVSEGGIYSTNAPPVVAEDIVTGSVAGGATVQSVTEPIQGTVPVRAAGKNAGTGTVPVAASLAEIAAVSVQKKATPSLPQDERGGNKEASSVQKQAQPVEANQTVSSMIAQMEEGPQQQSETAAAALYTVDTPEQAAARQGLIFDKLVDQERCVGCDLAGMNLAGEHFKEFDLERVNFTGCNLQGADFEEANLKGATFRDADLQNADFRKADIYRADFTNANLTGARFDEALMDSADFTGAKGLVFGEEQPVK